MNEKLSALLDDELSEIEREALLRQMGRDPELQGMWERYHVIGSALRRELGALAPRDLSDRIRERVATEALAPVSAGRMRFGRPVYKAAAALALAASVAAVAILTVRPSLSPEVVPQTTASAGSRTLQAAGTAPDSPAVASARDNALNAMLVKHSEFSPAVGMNGLASYVRVVGHGVNRNSAEK